MKKLLFAAWILAVTVNAFAQHTNVRLEGQVVCCEECWARADRTKVEFGTAEDLLKAQSCVANGDPTLLAVREGERFTLYQLDPGKFRLPGKNWLEFIGQHIEVTGSVQQRKSTKVMRVDTLKVLRSSIAERQAAQVSGKEVELTLKDPFGTTQSLSALKGRIVVLNFWATYCIPCRKEMPDLAEIQNDYGALGVQVIGASADEPEEREQVLRFVKETKVNFPIWMGATPSDMMRFGLGAALPGTVVVGRDGRIVRVISGVIDKADLKKTIDELLGAAARAAAIQREEVSAESPKSEEASSVPS